MMWADQDNYLAWAQIETAPPGLTAALRAANQAVRSATLTARYDTDAAGQPVDPAVANALTAAACAHAAYLLDVGDVTGAATGTEMTVGSVRIHRGDTVSLAAEAHRVLHTAGLAGAQPHIIG